uniref:Uncharacterized protein n=1 Tax=viral metagenome TaxID=1070528 RepID=A0A6C0ADH9_9ZZZZ
MCDVFYISYKLLGLETTSENEMYMIKNSKINLKKLQKSF